MRITIVAVATVAALGGCVRTTSKVAQRSVDTIANVESDPGGAWITHRRATTRQTIFTTTSLTGERTTGGPVTVEDRDRLWFCRSADGGRPQCVEAQWHGATTGAAPLAAGPSLGELE